MQIFSSINQTEDIKVYAFVGPSGTGKSYRAQMVANENGISYIIDDGLLINENNVVCGTSAKKAPTKLETVKGAIFVNEKDRNEMKKAIKKYKPKSILILGTSDGMIEKITENLGLPKPYKTIYIQDVATETEMETAKRIRTTQGKHVIPVPTFEIKKDFSGYILDPLKIFKLKDRGNEPYMAERSDAIYKVMRTRVESKPEGPNIYMEVSINYGYNILEALREFKQNLKREIEILTTMSVQDITIVAKGIHMDDEKKQQVEEKIEGMEE